VLFITHDLGVVAEFAARTVVMYAGRVVEAGRTADVLAAPRHPYTAGLLASIPRLAPPGAARMPVKPIPGQPPDLRRPPAGCAFHPRCASAQSGRCDTTPPPLEREGSRAVACLRWRELATHPMSIPA
jgi:oligopeptide transport system ATP-binding protein